MNTKLILACAMTTGLLASGQAISWTMQSITVPGASNNLKISAFNSQGTMAIRDSNNGNIYRRLSNGQVTQFIDPIRFAGADAMNENGDFAIAGVDQTVNPGVTAIRIWNANGTVQTWQDPQLGGNYGSLLMWGMNESRQTVGTYVRDSPTFFGACGSYSPNSSLLLTPMGASFAKDISNDGTIVGMNEYRPGTWDLAGNYTALPLPVGDTSGAAHVITES
ncbi:MAG: hypothetical protein J0L72_12135, partial [Armatimonadetes bacterium]|nr:hypothetical protein [Armatimonadota bacterium]